MMASQAQWLGHAEPETTLLRAFQARRLHHGWLLAGPEGIGKRSFALAAAAHLLTRSPDFAAGHFDGDMHGTEGRLLLEGKHPDCHYITLGPQNDKEARKAEEDEEDWHTERQLRTDVEPCRFDVDVAQSRLGRRGQVSPARFIRSRIKPHRHRKLSGREFYP